MKTIKFWGEDYHQIEELSEGWSLIAHPNGPAICDGHTISTIDPCDEDDRLRDIKREAIRAYREFSWPIVKANDPHISQLRSV